MKIGYLAHGVHACDHVNEFNTHTHTYYIYKCLYSIVCMVWIWQTLTDYLDFELIPSARHTDIGFISIIQHSLLLPSTLNTLNARIHFLSLLLIHRFIWFSSISTPNCLSNRHCLLVYLSVFPTISLPHSLSLSVFYSL